MGRLELGLLGAGRRNDALERATLHVLTERFPGMRPVGRSDWGGFTLYGPVETAQVSEAVTAAMTRLRAGEKELAIHPHCGTNLATGFVLAGVASSAVLGGRRRSRLEKVLELVIGVGAALSVAQPLGAEVQRVVTTDPDVSRLIVSRILRLERGTVVVHRVETVQGHG